MLSYYDFWLHFQHSMNWFVWLVFFCFRASFFSECCLWSSFLIWVCNSALFEQEIKRNTLPLFLFSTVSHLFFFFFVGFLLLRIINYKFVRNKHILTIPMHMILIVCAFFSSQIIVSSLSLITNKGTFMWNKMCFACRIWYHILNKIAWNFHWYV